MYLCMIILMKLITVTPYATSLMCLKDLLWFTMTNFDSLSTVCCDIMLPVYFLPDLIITVGKNFSCCANVDSMQCNSNCFLMTVI